ncbi:MAG: hypothetical protein M3063_01855 [Actinomycetota bacterium]|nr:hypothetical protein [Actinomycetota bacterium]
MSNNNTVARTLHDLGLAAWFGGSLMGAVGLNGAAAEASDPTERARIATKGWKRWAPVNAAAISGHLIGGALIVKGNKSRIAGQNGVATWTVGKAALTAAALAATGASGYFGRKMADTERQDIHVEGSTEPSSVTPDSITKAQKALRALQWGIPVLTGGLLVTSARMGEQQRPSEVGAGLLSTMLPG